MEASVLKNQRAFQEAINIFTKLNIPQNEQFHVRDELAECYYLSGDSKKAKAILEGNPLSHSGALILAKIYFQEHNSQEAFNILKPRLGRNPKIDSFFNTYFGDKGVYEEDIKEVPFYNKLQNEISKFNEVHNPQRTIFIMMKFIGGDSHKDSKLQRFFETIKLELDKYGLDAVRADEKNYSSTDYIWDNVQIYLNGTEYGIAVLENLYSEEMNPNVALEYGYSLAKNKKILLLKEKSFNNIKADILGKMWKEFEIDNIESIRKAISNWMVDLGQQRIKGY